MESALGIVESEFHLRKVQMRKELSDQMIETLLDKNQIKQVFINLLLNALQAVERGGLVTVSSIVDVEAGRIRVTVADDGCGIETEHLKKVFEPFFSTKRDGTGLGLAVSYGIVRNHEGQIRVASEAGQGTRFTVEFPDITKKREDREVS